MVPWWDSEAERMIPVLDAIVDVRGIVLVGIAEKAIIRILLCLQYCKKKWEK